MRASGQAQALRPLGPGQAQAEQLCRRALAVWRRRVDLLRAGTEGGPWAATPRGGFVDGFPCLSAGNRKGLSEGAVVGESVSGGTGRVEG